MNVSEAAPLRLVGPFRLFYLLLLATLLVLPIFLIPYERTMNPVVDSKELACKILLAMLGISAAIAIPRSSRRPLDLTLVCLFLVVATNVISALFSGKFLYCLFTTWHLWLLPMLAAALYGVKLPVSAFEKIVWTVIASATLTVLYAYMVYFSVDLFRSFYPFSYSVEEGRNFLHSFLGNPEYYGGYLSPIALLCFARFFRPRSSNVVRASWVGLMVVFLVTLLMTGSRGALLGFFVGSAVVVAFQYHRFSGRGQMRVKVAILAAIAGLSAVLVVFSTPNPLNFRRMNVAGRFVDLFNLSSPSIRERIFFYSLSSDMVTRNPVFGSGPGTFRVEFYPALERLEMRDEKAGVRLMIEDLRNRVAEHAHNDYLETWTETGTLGIAALLLLLSRFLQSYFSFHMQGAGQTPDEQDEKEIDRLVAMRTGCFAAALCIFINAAFSFPMHMPVRASLFWVILGCYFASDRLVRDKVQLVLKTI